MTFFEFCCTLKRCFTMLKTVLKDYCFLHFAPTSRAKACYRLDVEGSLPLPQTQQHVPARAVGNTAVLVSQRNQTEPSDHYALIERFKQWL